MNTSSITQEVTASAAVALKTSITKIDAKSIGVAALGLCYNKV